MQPIAAADTALLAFSTLMLMLGVPAVSGMEAAQLLSLGDKAYSAGEYSSAVRHYTSALDKDAAAAMIYTKRAAAYMSLRQHSQALKDLDRWGATPPVTSHPWVPPCDVHCLLDWVLSSCPTPPGGLSALPCFPMHCTCIRMASKPPTAAAGGSCLLHLPASSRWPPQPRPCGVLQIMCCRALELNTNYTQGYIHRGKLHRWGLASQSRCSSSSSRDRGDSDNGSSTKGRLHHTADNTTPPNHICCFWCCFL